MSQSNEAQSAGPPDVLRSVHYTTGGEYEIAVRRRVVARTSRFQNIVVVDTDAYGRCLVIDGVMQTASTDHHLYDEAILAPMRPTDREVLVVGGGDGYVSRTAFARNPALRLVMVDIDPEVVAVAEAHLNPGFSHDPRLKLHIGDGVAFARSLEPKSFDGVVLDLTDIPLDPARSVDIVRLYEDMLTAVLPLLRAGGWLSMQGGPSEVQPGVPDVASRIAEMLDGRLDALERLDVFIPSYAEKNAFFHGHVRPEVTWHDCTFGIGLSTTLTMRPVFATGAVEVYEHDRLGRALVVDGTLQDIDQDPVWREMLAHVPLLGAATPPRRVLVVGGGDGLLLREILRHDFVERAVVWDDTAGLGEAGGRFLGTGAALADPRTQVVADAGAVDGPFDLIFNARADLRRPGDAKAVGARLGAWLAPAGAVVDADAVVMYRSGVRWYRDLADAGPALPATLALPEQARWFGHGAVVPGGYYGFTLRAAQPHDWSRARADFEARHYNTALHRAAFALPRVIRELP
jgi:spermidine synthase